MRPAAVIAALLVASAASADVVSEKPDAVTVTLYHEGAVDTAELMRGGNDYSGAFAFITETRTVELPAGPSVIRFRGVASTMVPQSASIAGLPEGALEKNFDYDLLSPGSLLSKSVDKTVHLVRTNPKTGVETDQAAIVRAASGGPVLDIGGKIEALHCGGPPERLVFDQVPEGLSDTPTFSVKAVSPVAGRYTVKLAYIATRMNWSADYVAHVRGDGDTLELTGWITLANFSDTSFADAPTSVVAGHPNTTGDDRPVNVQALFIASQCWPLDVAWGIYPPPPPPPPPEGAVETVVVTGSRIPEPGIYSASPVTAVSYQDIRAQNLSEYKLYPLPEPTTVAARQTKQVQFLDRPAVKFERFYTYRSDVDTIRAKDTSEPAVIRYRMQNREDEGLGKPLPAGTMAVMQQQADGRPLFVGQQAVDDMPVGLPVEIDTGQAIDVRAERHVAAFDSYGKDLARRIRETLEIAAVNDKPVPVRFELVQDMSADGARIVSEDRSHTMDRGNAKWTLALAAHERIVVRYTVEYASQYPVYER